MGKGNMNDFNNISSITIEYDDLADLLSKETANPLADEEIPHMISEAIKRGIPVYVKGVGEKEKYNLSLEGSNFKLIPII